MLKKSILSLSLALLPLCSFAAKPSLLDVDQSFKESTLVIPSSFENGARQLQENWYLQNYGAIDSLAAYRENIPASDSEIIDRLSKIPAIMELPFNSLVKSSIVYYTERKRSQVSNMIALSYYYFPIFEQALEKQGLPHELKYLAIIESALNPNAVSVAGATGLWQFMTATARGLNLEVNSLVDERRDPIKSSDMAAKYLGELYSIYHDWSLALASYNCGMGNVNKALRRVPGNDKADFWTIYPFLNRETSGYVPGFIAAAYVMNYYKEHNIAPALTKRPLVTDTISVNKRIHFRQIADVLQIPVEEIRILNPQYIKDIIPGDIHPYTLTLPTQQIAAYILSEDSIVAHDAEKYARRLTVTPSDGSHVSVSEDGDYIITEKTFYHKVRKKETLTSIARKYGVTVSSIRQANNGIKKAKRNSTLKIVVVEKKKRPQTEYEIRTDSINVPDNSENVDSVSVQDQPAPAQAEQKVQPGSKPEVQPKQKTKKKDSNSPQYIKVRKGDNLSKIAQRYGTTVAKIRKLNNLSNDKIKAGQKLRVK